MDIKKIGVFGCGLMGIWHRASLRDSSLKAHSNRHTESIRQGRRHFGREEPGQR